MNAPFFSKAIDLRLESIHSLIATNVYLVYASTFFTSISYVNHTWTFPSLNYSVPCYNWI